MAAVQLKQSLQQGTEKHKYQTAAQNTATDDISDEKMAPRGKPTARPQVVIIFTISRLALALREVYRPPERVKWEELGVWGRRSLLFGHNPPSPEHDLQHPPLQPFAFAAVSPSLQKQRNELKSCKHP